MTYMADTRVPLKIWFCWVSTFTRPVGVTVGCLGLLWSFFEQARSDWTCTSELRYSDFYAKPTCVHPNRTCPYCTSSTIPSLKLPVRLPKIILSIGFLLVEKAHNRHDVVIQMDQHNFRHSAVKHRINWSGHHKNWTDSVRSSQVKGYRYGTLR